MTLPLEGLRVADFSQLAQGPFATQILGDLGADIIKIEPPKGDWMRSYALQDHYPGGVSISFLAFNRNKRSIALDLRTDEGQAVARRIVASADAVIENFRPGVMERLGVGYDEVAALNPEIVYCSSTGWGSDGPYARRPGQDLLVQSMAALPQLNGTAEDAPTPVGFGVADLTTGLHIVYSVLAALLGRERGRGGRRIEVNLYSSIIALMSQEFTTFMSEGSFPDRDPAVPGSPHAGAPYGVYPTRDGYIAVAMADIATVARILGVDELVETDSSNTGGEAGQRIRRLLAAGFRRDTTARWVERMLAEDLWVAPVQDFAEVVEDPQVAANDLLVDVPHPSGGTFRAVGNPVRLSGHDAKPLRVPPTLGQHSREILAELGYEDDEVESLLGNGSVR
jgi:crotonobetainyl-CoA:carnitine CoA-transferase CaiB-like acyl-CoA transferase